MTINSFRGVLYRLSKYLGDWQALTSKKDHAVTRRVGRRIIGKVTGRAIGKLFR